MTRGSTALAQAIDDEQLADDDDDACEQEIKEPVLKVFAIMEVRFYLSPRLAHTI